MTEVVAALLAFLTVGIFLAHAFDVYRTGKILRGAASAGNGWRVLDLWVVTPPARG